MLAWYHGLVTLMANVLLFFYHISHSYGVAVILITIAVRLIIMPFYGRQMRSMKRMQTLSPQIKELQAKYKGDPQKLNQATMQLYKDNNVNLAAGCLPTILQLPFLWALFQALETFHYVGSSSFLWLTNLSGHDPLYILPILAAVTTFWQTKISSMQMSTDKSQQMITQIILPIFIFYMSIRFPAGLSLYWVVSNLFAIGQQYFMVNRPEMAAAEAKAK